MLRAPEHHGGPTSSECPNALTYLKTLCSAKHVREHLTDLLRNSFRIHSKAFGRNIGATPTSEAFRSINKAILRGSQTRSQHEIARKHDRGTFRGITERLQAGLKQISKPFSPTRKCPGTFRIRILSSASYVRELKLNIAQQRSLRDLESLSDSLSRPAEPRYSASEASGTSSHTLPVNAGIPGHARQSIGFLD